MQFSIRLLMALVLVAGLFCGLTFGLPAIVAPIIQAAAITMLPGSLIALMVYARGAARAFAIGALPSAVPFALYAPVIGFTFAFETPDEKSVWQARMVFGVACGLIFLGGAAAATIRWACLPRRRRRPVLDRSVEQAGPIYSGRIGVPANSAVAGDELTER